MEAVQISFPPASQDLFRACLPNPLPFKPPLFFLLPSLMRLGEAFEALPPSFLVPCCHKRALHNPLLFSSPPAISPIAFVIRNHISQSFLLSLSLSPAINKRENTTQQERTTTTARGRLPTPSRGGRSERSRERDKRERAIRVSAEIRDGILIRQVSRSLAPSPGFSPLSLSSLHLWPWLA